MLYTFIYIYLICSSTLQRKLRLNEGSELLKATQLLSGKGGVVIQACL